MEYDVLVVGGGMVGTTLACLLGDQGLRVAVVEGQCPVVDEAPEGFDIRVSALTRASQRVLDAIGAWEAMERRRVCPYYGMEVWDATGSGAINFDADAVGEPDLGHIVENRVIEASLLERAQAQDHIDYLCPSEPLSLVTEADGAALTLADGRELWGRLVVGADGAGSWVREQAGITVTGWLYAQTAVVAVVKTSCHHQHVARQRFAPDGALAFLPLPGGYSSVVWSTAPERAGHLMELDDERFLDELQAAFGDRLGRMEWTGERAAFPLRLQHADDYVRFRVALAGNAAHVVHPLAGQGLNLGISDAAALAEVLADARAVGRDIGAKRVLRRYERWRKGDNVAVMAAMDAFKRLFGSGSHALRWARNVGLGLIDEAAPLKNLLVRRAMGLSGDLPRLCRGGRQQTPSKSEGEPV